MRKGYKETMPKASHDKEGLPIFGAAWALEKKKQKKVSAAEQRRREVYKRNSERPINWAENIRTASSTSAGYEYINFEGVYRGFRQRLIEDPAFEHQILEMIMDRILSELYVPLNHRPQAGLRLSLVRKPVAKEDQS